MRGAGWTWLGIGLAVFASASCAVPVWPARTGEIADPGRLRLRGTWNLLAVAPSSATLISTDERHTPSGEYDDVWTAYRARAAAPGVDAVASVFFSTEGYFAVGVFPGCELGGLIGLMRAGVEARCAPLDADRGAPFDAALSIGIAQQYNLTPIDTDRYYAGQELHAGLDLSKRVGFVAPLVNVNLGYLPQYREIQGRLPVIEHIEWGNDQGDIFIVRDELRLSVPLGVAFVFDHGHREKERRARVVLALIPEITLRARNRRAPKYESLEGSMVTGFEQRWALYLTLGGELEP